MNIVILLNNLHNIYWIIKIYYQYLNIKDFTLTSSNVIYYPYVL